MDRIGGGSAVVCAVATGVLASFWSVSPASAGSGRAEAREVRDAGEACSAPEMSVRAPMRVSPSVPIGAVRRDSDYYSIDLVPTRRVPATAYVRGTAEVTFSPSPFVVTVTPDGSYDYEVHVRLPELREPRGGGYVAWVTTTEIDEIHRLGQLQDGRVSGRVAWNKFLVVVTLEEDPMVATGRWTGPIAFRGMSRSGTMHTMAGHGPFQDEKCAAYGYQ